MTMWPLWHNVSVRPPLPMVAGVLLVCMGVVACGSSGKDAIRAHNGMTTGGEPSTVAGTTAPASQSSRKALAASPFQHVFKGDEDDDDSRANETPGNTTGDNDSDFDNDKAGNRPTGYRDSDDAEMLEFGQAAGPDDVRAISAVVERYYRAVTRLDGSAACRLMYSVLRESVVEDYGEGAGPVYSQGKTCAVVTFKTFKHAHAQLIGSFHVTDARVHGKQGYAFVGSRTEPATYIQVHRERTTWTIDQLTGIPLP